MKHESMMFAAFWMSVAIAIYAMAGCEARSKEAYYKYRTEKPITEEAL